MITLFARKEFTQDPIDKSLGFHRRKNTVLYRDAHCTDRVANWPWHYSNCPRRNAKTVVLNCWKWKLQWVADAARCAQQSGHDTTKKETHHNEPAAEKAVQ